MVTYYNFKKVKMFLLSLGPHLACLDQLCPLQHHGANILPPPYNNSSVAKRGITLLLNLFSGMSPVASAIPPVYFKPLVILLNISFSSTLICQCIKDLGKYSFQKYFLRDYYVLGVVLCIRHTGINKTNEDSGPRIAHIQIREGNTKR